MPRTITGHGNIERHGNHHHVGRTDHASVP
jgi:hypothetical protein